MKNETGTHWKELFDYQHLSPHDVGDKDVVLTIKGIDSKLVKNKQGEAICPIMYFEEYSKPWILNKINCRVIEKVYGKKIQKWYGKKLSLKVVFGYKAYGDVHDLFRVKEESPKEAPKPELKPSDKDTWNKAKGALDAKKATLEQIKKKYIVTPENEKLLCNSK